jgi:ribosomal protein S3
MGQKVHPLGFRLGISQDSVLPKNGVAMVLPGGAITASPSLKRGRSSSFGHAEPRQAEQTQQNATQLQNKSSFVSPSGIRGSAVDMRGYNSNWYSKPKKYSLNLQEDFLIRKYLLEKLQDANLSKIILSRQTEKILVEVHVGQPKIVTGEKGLRLKELTQGLQKTLMSSDYSTSYKGCSASYRNYTAKPLDGNIALDSELGEASPCIGAELQTQLRHDQDDGPNQLEFSSAQISKKIPSISFEVIQINQPATDARLLAKKIAEQLEKRVAFRRVMKQTVQLAREAGINGVKIQIAGRLNGAEIARSEWVREGRVPLHSLSAKMDYAQLGAQTIYGTLGIKVWLFTA